MTQAPVLHLAHPASSFDASIGWARLRLAVQRVGMQTGARRRPVMNLPSAGASDERERDWDGTIVLCDGRLVLRVPVRR